jgi:hypothetical protein
MSIGRIRGRAAALVLAALTLGTPAALARGIAERLDTMLSGIPADRIPTGILYDRVVGLSHIEEHDGTPASRPAARADWLRIYDELLRAAGTGPGAGVPAASAWPSPDALLQRAAGAPAGEVPLAILNVHYARIRPEALETGALVARNGHLELGTGDAFEVRRVFAAAPLRDHTYRGEQIRFRLDRAAYLGNDSAAPTSIEIDFDDGGGFVSVSLDGARTVRYATPGTKTIHLRLAFAGGARLEAAALFEVRGLRTPSPNDTLHIAARIPYQGGYATGDAYVYLADTHTTITEPAVVLEGFDLDNSMNWDELYALLNRENLLENLRADGFDAVVLNFTDATDYMQRNAFVALELIEQMRATIGTGRTMVLAGASMGGLIGRYTLDYAEAHGIDPAVRTFISFDAPQTGADIPLGIQYWLWFFADQSADAAAWLVALDSPASRQLLAYHHTNPPGGTGEVDPLRTQFLAELASMGDWPSALRKVAIANGSGARTGQGFNPADQIIRWEYTSFLVDITGDVWAVPDATSSLIFHGLIDFILLPPEETHVTVSGTRPYDNAPGGWRATMAEMDAIDPGYGDIVALHPNHGFIPTVSALAVATNDLFYDIAGDPDILAHTPFDAVYFPVENQEHVDINAQNAPWLRAEIEAGAGSVADGAPGEMRVAQIEPIAPNPLAGSTRVRFAVPRAGETRVTVYDAAGRQVARLEDGRLAAGVRETTWDGRDARGRRLAPGVYLVRLSGDGFAAARKVIVR